MKTKLFINTFILTAAVILLSFPRPIHAETRVEVDGLVFTVDKVSYGTWTKPRHHMVNDMVDHVNESDTTLSYIAISYTLTNNNDSKKIDLDGKFSYKLFDNLENRYRPMRKPADYNSSVLIVSKNFPSLFPGETYGETLFFEAPISTAKSVKLTIDMEKTKLSQPVEIVFVPQTLLEQRVPAEPVIQPAVPRSKQSQITTPKTNSGESAPSGPGIKITSPLPGICLKQGESSHMRVVSESGQLPKKLIIISLDNTFVDPAPTKDSVYDLNVPPDQAPGAYMVNIIAEWSNGDVSSTSLDFFVKDAAPLAVL